MLKDEIMEGVCGIIRRDLFVPSHRLSYETELHDLGFDSLGLMDFALELEEEFSIELSSTDLETITTLEELVELILEKQKYAR